MPSYFFQCLGIVAEEQAPIEVVGLGATLLQRRWKATTFDFAALAAKHNLNFSWHLMDIFAARSFLEIEIKDAESLEDAQEKMRVLQAMLYLSGSSPFVAPIVMSRPSITYSALSNRDQDNLDGLPDELRQGFTSKDGKIEGWLHEPAFQCQGIGEKRFVTPAAFLTATQYAFSWTSLELSNKALSTARRALQTAPMIINIGSSLLHLWQGIESLFPTVSTEVNFRISLLVSQLCQAVESNRLQTYQTAKRAYKVRSRAAHGSTEAITLEDWMQAWDLLTKCLMSCLRRGCLPSEDVFYDELLS